jgi:hypothetical protein
MACRQSEAREEIGECGGEGLLLRRSQKAGLLFKPLGPLREAVDFVEDLPDHGFACGAA